MPDHDNTVSAQERIDECFPEKNPIGHITDSCTGLVADIFEADGITDLGAFQVNGNHITSQVTHFLDRKSVV